MADQAGDGNRSPGSRWRTAAAIVAVAALGANAAPANADWLGFLDRASSDVQRRLTGNATRDAADLARGLVPGLPRATLKPTLDGGFRVSDGYGHVIASIRPGEDLATVSGLAGRRIVIQNAILTHNPDVVRSLLERPDLRVAVDGDGRLWDLRLQPFGDRNVIVVDASPTLSLTLEAFARRSGLEGVAVASLVERMRVIPLIASDDVLGIGQFRRRVARLAGIPDSREAALRMIAESGQNLIVVTGHVEHDAFVVRPATGSGFTVPFADIQQAADAGRSKVLFLGCRVACENPLSGPLKDIYQPDIIDVLSDLDTTGNALSLMQQLSQKVGPLLIQEDHGGGFRVIDAAFARGQDFRVT